MAKHSDSSRNEFTCSAPAVGALLPAYELRALSDEDVESFELHLMECDHCLNEALSFEEEAGVLRTSSRAREAVRQIAAKTEEQESLWSRVWSHLWPQTPLVFRPALAWTLVIALAVPAFYGLERLNETAESARPAQTIRLVGMRSTTSNVLSIEAGLDGAIAFAAPGFAEGTRYNAVVLDSAGVETFRLERFGAIDRAGMGQIILPHATMKPGLYELVVTDAAASGSDKKADQRRCQYRFRIAQ